MCVCVSVCLRVCLVVVCYRELHMVLVLNKDSSGSHVEPVKKRTRGAYLTSLIPMSGGVAFGSWHLALQNSGR